MRSKLKRFSFYPSEILFGFTDVSVVFVLSSCCCFLRCLSSHPPLMPPVICMARPRHLFTSSPFTSMQHSKFNERVKKHVYCWAQVVPTGPCYPTEEVKGTEINQLQVIKEHYFFFKLNSFILFNVFWIFSFTAYEMLFSFIDSYFFSCDQAVQKN